MGAIYHDWLSFCQRIVFPDTEFLLKIFFFLKKISFRTLMPSTSLGVVSMVSHESAINLSENSLYINSCFSFDFNFFFWFGFILLGVHLQVFVLSLFFVSFFLWSCVYSCLPLKLDKCLAIWLLVTIFELLLK